MPPSSRRADANHGTRHTLTVDIDNGPVEFVVMSHGDEAAERSARFGEARRSDGVGLLCPSAS
jgi:hypothetical protein